MQANQNLFGELRGARRLADFLIEAVLHFCGRHVFAMPAESLNPICDAIRRQPESRLITVRHEGNGALMAASYAKLTGRLGVCMGTAGPGATHLPLGTYDALADHAPLLAITGQVPLHQVGSGGFQEVDLPGLFADSTIWSRAVSAVSQHGLIPLAAAYALTRRQPVHLAFCSDLLGSPLPQGAALRLPREALDATVQSPPSLISAASARLREVRGRSAVIIGAVDDSLREAAELLAEQLRAPIFVLPEGIHYLRGASTNPSFPFSGQSSDPLYEVLEQAQGLVLIGPLTAALRAVLLPRIPIVQIATPWEVNHATHRAVVRLWGDRSHVLRTLAAELAAPPGFIPHTLLERAGAASGSGPAEDAALWRLIDQLTPQDAVLAIEPGRLMQGALHKLPLAARTVLSSFGLRAPGFAVPGAIAAALASPQRAAIAVATMEGLIESMGELTTARQHGLPIRILCAQRAHQTLDLAAYAQAAGFTVSQVQMDDAQSLHEVRALEGPSPHLILICPRRDATSASLVIATPSSPRGELRTCTLADTLCELLVRAGAERVYGRQHPVLAALSAALDRSEHLRFVATSQAEGAAMMASAAAKHTGRLCVCAVGTEYDLIQQLNGLYDAAFDRARVLLVHVQTGDGTDAPQVVNADRLLAEVCRVRVRVKPGPAAAEQMAQAIQESLRAGGVNLLIVQAKHLEQPDAGAPDWLVPSTGREALVPPRAALFEAAVRLHTARQPVILFGRGAHGAGAEIDVLARLLRAPLVATMPGRGAVPDTHPHFVGAIGASGHRTATDSVNQSDVLLVLGSSNRGAVFGMDGDFLMIQVDHDPVQLGQRPFRGLGLCGSIRETVAALTEAIFALRADGPSEPSPPPPRPATTLLRAAYDLLSPMRIEGIEDGVGRRALLGLQALLDSLPRDLRRQAQQPAAGTSFYEEQRQRYEAWQGAADSQRPEHADGKLPPPAVCRVLLGELRALGLRPAVTVDVGVNTLWAYRYFVGDSHPMVWSSSFATMGFALPAAAALCELSQRSPMIALCGDGGLAITIAELLTAARYELPLLVVVFNNGKLAAVKFEQEVMGWPEFETGLGNQDLAAMARACGVRGIRVTKAAQLAAAFRDALTSGRPCLVDVVCDPHHLPSPPRIHLQQSAGYALALTREAGLRLQEVLLHVARPLGLVPSGDPPPPLLPKRSVP